MPRLLSLLIIFLMTCGPLFAGAWPRGKGNHFFSTTSRLAAESIDGPYSIYSTFYYEYGMTDQLTVGVDFGRAVSGASKALAYARWPIGTPTIASRYSFEIGAGRISGEAVIRPGVSFGRGLETNLGHGWITIDSVAEYHIKSGNTDFKADFSFGIDLAPRLKMILQLQTGAPYGDQDFLRFAPSMVMKTTAKSHIEFGATAGIKGDSQFGIKLGLWREF